MNKNLFSRNSYFRDLWNKELWVIIFIEVIKELSSRNYNRKRVFGENVFEHEFPLNTPQIENHMMNNCTNMLVHYLANNIWIHIISLVILLRQVFKLFQMFKFTNNNMLATTWIKAHEETRIRYKSHKLKSRLVITALLFCSI